MLTPEHVLEKEVSAYNARDIKAFAACFSENIQFFNLVSNELRLDGKEKLIEGFTQFFSSSPNLKLEIRSRMTFGDFVIDHEWVTGAAKYPDGVEIISINYVRNGLIEKIWFTR